MKDFRMKPTYSITNKAISTCQLHKSLRIIGKSSILIVITLLLMTGAYFNVWVEAAESSNLSTVQIEQTATAKLKGDVAEPDSHVITLTSTSQTNCSYTFSTLPSANPVSFSFNIAAGWSGEPTATYTLNVQSNCTWAVTSGADWVSITESSPSNGQFKFTVPQNSGTARRGVVTLVGQDGSTFRWVVIQQSGSPCSYSFSPASPLQISHAAYSGTVNVITNNNGSNSPCNWTAWSAFSNSWDIPEAVTITGASGTGSGTITFNVSGNTGSGNRNIGIEIGASGMYEIHQAGFSTPTPNAPTNVTTQPVSQNQINVFWNASNSANVTGYNLRVNGSTIIPGITYLSYPVKNLNPNTTCTFEVQAVNSSGAVSAWSPPVQAKTQPAVGAPSTPTGIKAQVVSALQVNLFWNQNPANENVTGYNIRVDGITQINNIPYLSYAVRNVSADTVHTFEVQAVNAGGTSDWSAPISAKTPNLVPTAPKGLVTQVVSSSQINMFWDGNSETDYVTGYNLEVDGKLTFGIKYLSYPVKNLTPNTTHTFRVQAVNANGASFWSEPITAVTTAVLPPSNLSTQVVSSSQINVFWNASNSPNVVGYNLRVNGTTVIPGIAYLSYPVKNLTANTTYTFEVQTVTAEGFSSAWSTPVQATTLAPTPPPEPPTTVSPQVVSDSQINVFWNASTSPNIAYYNLRVSGSNLISRTSYLSYPVKFLSGGTTYTFEIQAVDSSGGVSAWSPPVSATTNPPVVLLAPPTEVSAQVVSSSQINVFWNASTSRNVVSYAVRVNGLVVYGNFPYLSYAVKNLTANTTYTFEVASINSAGTISAFSTPVSATTAAASVPNAPTNVSPQSVSQTQINVFWNGNPANENVTSYNLRVNGSNVITGIIYLSYPVKNLTAGMTYTFEVQAVNANGVSNWSSPVQATTAAALSTPSIAAAQTVSSNQINVFWNGAQQGENVTSYNLRINGGTVITGITYLSYPVKNLNPNTTYTFEVQAVGPKLPPQEINRFQSLISLILLMTRIKSI
jgi:hypothetical protein